MTRLESYAKLGILVGQINGATLILADVIKKLREMGYNAIADEVHHTAHDVNGTLYRISKLISTSKDQPNGQ